MNPYETYPHLWCPPQHPSLFIVKVPAAIESLSEKVYRELMVQRLDWMISRWMENGNSLEVTQTFLVTSLSEFDSSQYHPLIDLDEETFSTWTWRQEWAEAFIHHNPRFSEVLHLQGIETDFPVYPVLPEHPDFLKLLEIHQETDLETWLTELMPSSWE